MIRALALIPGALGLVLTAIAFLPMWIGAGCLMLADRMLHGGGGRA